MTRESAIALVERHPAFRAGLAARPGYTVRAYDAENSYQVWHVEFYEPESPQDGDHLIGFADVSLKHDRVFYYEADYGATDAQVEEAKAVIDPFVRRNAEVRAMVRGITDDLSEKEIYVWHGWRNLWAAQINLAADSIRVIILFDTEARFIFENPKVDGFQLPEVGTFEEWKNSRTAELGLIAVKDSALAAVLREHPGWKIDAEPGDGNSWVVRFFADQNAIGKPFVQAVIDLKQGKVVSFKEVG